MKRFSFGYKLMASYVLLVIVPVISIGYYAYYTSVQYVKEQTIQNVTSTLKQVRDNIEGRMKTVEQVDNQLYLDQSLQQALNKRYEPLESYQTVKEKIIPKLESALNLSSNNVVIELFLHNETLPEIYDTETGEDPLLNGKRYNLIHYHQIEQLDWVRRFDDMPVDSIWMQIGSDSKFGNVSWLRKMMDFRTIQPIGTMRITVKMDDLFGNLNYSDSEDGIPGYFAVINEQNETVYEKRSNPLPQDWKAKAEAYMQIHESIEGINFRIMALVPLQELEHAAQKVRNMTLLICGASFLILVAIGAIVSNTFSKQIYRIARSLRAFQDGNFAKRIQYTGSDEFAQIAVAFNEMAENIEDLIQEVYVTNLQKKEAELDALQAQINPHFLYNTLSSISRLARLGKTEKLHQMVSELATFYRLTLNQGRSIIPIREEIQQVRSYIGIQKIKHVDRLDVSFDIHFSVLEYDTVKLILQPFVENALKHAMFEEPLHIRIVAHQEEGTIVMKVIDNGVGMSEETMSKILGSKDQSIGYGIRNVNERIKLQFGESFGVTIESELGRGTTVRIVIPLYRELSVQSDVS
ncbi:sensor histidine kinase [Paenibacillus azoreducens]|uniref:histidine kinase n=1 Tax=Paenibacillus azoreducens TaxID=116718 RepID=A0A919YDB8_9BACL|nr:histidine kinase [Paenibacillus azoreducens]GIO46985.1 sensor histidine kinase [Paenibacillus azoreducens]